MKIGLVFNMADDLAKEIVNFLKDYTNDVIKGIERQSIKIANKGVKELKRTSPRRFHGGKHYADGWGRSTVDNAQVIHNKSKSTLTHLLEYGHAKRGGGRVAGKAHIGPVEDRVVDEYEKMVERVIKNGGDL